LEALAGPLWVDAVDKVSDEQSAGNNRIQVPSSLNQYGAPDSYLESMLLTRHSKNVYRQHRSLGDISASLADICSRNNFRNFAAVVRHAAYANNGRAVARRQDGWLRLEHRRLRDGRMGLNGWQPNSKGAKNGF
jgi:hypothetical protein